LTRSFITKAAAAAAVVTLAVAPGVVQAQNTILNFTGTARINDPNPALGAGNTLVIDFLTRSGTTLIEGAARGTIDAGSNNFGIAAGTTGEITDLVATQTGTTSGGAPIGGSFVGTPINPFVTLGGYTFVLTGTETGNTFGPVSLFQQGTSVLAGFNVSGTVTGPAFGTMTRTFSGVFSTQFDNTTIATVIRNIDLGQGLQSDFSARFTVNPAASVVPEPSTYALMASGVAMLGAFARRRRQA
jgi:hypothetical protein